MLNLENAVVVQEYEGYQLLTQDGILYLVKDGEVLQAGSKEYNLKDYIESLGKLEQLLKE